MGARTKVLRLDNFRRTGRLYACRRPKPHYDGKEMNPLNLETLAKVKACAPEKVEDPNYVIQLPHRFGRFFGLRGDGFQTGSVTLYGEWAHEESCLLESLIEPGDWVLDCGANTGSMMLAFASRVAPSGRVFSFEPQKIPCDCLIANVAANSLSHLVIAMKVAVGKEDGEIPCPLLDPRKVNNFGGCTLVEPEIHTAPTETVALIAIDSLGLARCDLIKADVEGMEPDVLQGAFQTITKHRPKLWVEQLVHREGSREDLLKIFAEHEYKAWRVCTWIASPRNIRNCRVNPFLFEDGTPMVDTNVLAIPKEMDPPPWIEKPDFYGTVEEFK